MEQETPQPKSTSSDHDRIICKPVLILYRFLVWQSNNNIRCHREVSTRPNRSALRKDLR